MKSIIYICLLFSLVSCNTQKRLAKKKAKEELLTADTNYRFSVSFISIGSGTDGKAKKVFEAFIADYNTKNKCKLVYETTPWGREGEVDYCFKLKELKAKQQESFITDLKEALKSSTLVRYQENSPCKKAR
ncbi:MAG: hypothetical protein V4622_03420 [Bacteroidota bacterium]